MFFDGLKFWDIRAQTTQTHHNWFVIYSSRDLMSMCWLFVLFGSLGRFTFACVHHSGIACSTRRTWKSCQELSGEFASNCLILLGFSSTSQSGYIDILYGLYYLTSVRVVTKRNLAVSRTAWYRMSARHSLDLEPQSSEEIYKVNPNRRVWCHLCHLWIWPWYILYIFIARITADQYLNLL